MTYKIKLTDDRWELVDSDGNVLESNTYPLKQPNDVIDAILEDLNVGTPEREAFRALFKQDWEVVDNRGSSSDAE